jgi:hypothetical protein
MPMPNRIRAWSGFAFAVLSLSVISVTTELTAKAAANQPTAPSVAVPPMTLRPELQFFSGLFGEWTGEGAHGQPIGMTFAPFAGGQCVSRRLLDNSIVMFTMFCVESGKVHATHFSVSGKHTRLIEAARSSSSLTLRFKDGVNVTSRDDLHLEELSYETTSSDTLVERIQYIEKGVESFRELFRVRRVIAQKQMALASRLDWRTRCE